jgi:hypothetical protein
MQIIRKSLTTAFVSGISTVTSRSKTLVGPLSIVQQIRLDGSDPRSSTSSENHKSSQQSSSSRGSDLNKSKGGDKKQRSTSTDDTNQPGATRKDWSNPNQVVGNDPQYGKGGSPSKGKKSK